MEKCPQKQTAGIEAGRCGTGRIKLDKDTSQQIIETEAGRLKKLDRFSKNAW